nr:unnamed protein product [Callosobruchus chinensis]
MLERVFGKLSIVDCGLTNTIREMYGKELPHEVPKRALGSNEQRGSAKKSLIQAFRSKTENMIWHEHVSSIATAAGKKLGYLFRARKYFSPSNFLTLYKAKKRPTLEYCLHI